MANSGVCVLLLFYFLLISSQGVIELEATTSQPYRTGYHFQPPKNWMNDPNGPMIYKGIYHLFYQCNPKAAVWGNIVWAHSTSTDLINWTPHDPAIFPSQPFDINGCWSGSTTILPNGQPIILYTGIDPNNQQVQNVAIPKNLSDPYLKEWVKTPKNPLISPTHKINGSLFRDPTTAWQGLDKKWRVIIGSHIKKNNQGVAIMYTSKDFKHWIKANHPLHSVKQTGMWECPDFFPVSTTLNGVDTLVITGLNIKHVLKVSLSNSVKFHDCYTIGRYDIVKDKYIPEVGLVDIDSGLRYDYGKFYASKTFFDSMKNRRVLWGWINESTSVEHDIKKGWSGLQAIPRNLWLHKSGKQLMQWPIVEIKKLRGKKVEWQGKLVKAGGSVVEVTGVTAAQADVEISFELTKFEKAQVLDPSWTNPQLLCSQTGASVKGGLGPFGLLVLASKSLKEYTAVFFRIFKAQSQHKYVVLMCSDQSRSSLDNDNDKTTHGAFLDLDPVHEKLSLRTLIDHSIVESFGGGGKACITARVYPTLAIDDKVHLYAFNNGTQNIKITKLSAWSMKTAQIN